jgi:hypothetical protein
MHLFRALVAAIALAAPSSARAQGQPTTTIAHQPQVWLGYMTQTRVSDRASLWNDAHIVPGGFYIVRTGATLHPTESTALTAGYAFLGLPVGSLTRDFKRTEHRPWAQGTYAGAITDRVRIAQRVRYDARFRRNVAEGALAEGFGLTHRLRFLATLRFDVDRLAFGDGWTPFVSVGDEVLLNFGRGIIYNRMDQNRGTAMIGAARRGITVQAGYMNRLVQLPSGHDLVMNHTVVLWVFHNIDARERPPDSREFVQPPADPVN